MAMHAYLDRVPGVCDQVVPDSFGKGKGDAYGAIVGVPEVSDII